jgi:hypothetical protein
MYNALNFQIDVTNGFDVKIDSPTKWSYVSAEHKEEILKKVANGRNEVSYKELQNYIRSRGVGATAGSFFRDQVKRYKKVGGNKNKKLILTSENVDV